MSFYTMLMLPLLNVGEERRMVGLREDEQKFVGLRTPRNGQQQIVYDAGKGARVVVTIADIAISAKTIDGALQESIYAGRFSEVF